MEMELGQTGDPVPGHGGLQNGSSAKSNSQPCTFCNEGNTSSSFCTDCKEFLCTECANYHGKMKKTKNHVVSSIEDGLLALEKGTGDATTAPPQDDDKCVIHDEPFSLYCVDCDEEICQKCRQSDHVSGHEFLGLSQCVTEFREMLEKAIPDLTAYQAKTDEALVDLEAKIKNTLGTEKVKLLSAAQTHVHKIQAILLQRELDIREEIVKKTLYKAKELNVKRASVERMSKQASQYLELIPKILEYNDLQLFSKREWLSKQYFRLRESVGILIDEKKYKDYVESDWFFHIGDGVLLETIMDLKALGSFVYTDGGSTQDKTNPLNPIVPVPVKQESIESIFEKKYRDTQLNGRIHPALQQSSPSKGDISPEAKVQNVEMEALETSVENEYIGFDMLKQQNCNSHGPVKESPCFSPGTTLAKLLDEKVTDHPEESDLLSKYIADKTNIEDGTDSNSEYDPVVQTAKGVESGKRRNTHSEESAEEQETTVPVAERRRGRPKGTLRLKPLPVETAIPGCIPSDTTAQATRKSSRFVVSPRPGLAVLGSKSSRRSAAKEKEKGFEVPKNPRGRQKSALAMSSTSTPKKPVGRPSGSAKVDDAAPPLLTREVFLDPKEVEELLVTPDESEESQEEWSPVVNQLNEKRSIKKRKQMSSDEDYMESEIEEQRPKSKSTPAKKKKDPFLATTRRRKSNRKKEEPSTSASVPDPKISMDILIEKMKISNYDENEDYCTVCLDGGDNLICCDNCPKVFHIKCHIPALHRIPPDEWQCIFCVEKEELEDYTREQDSTAVMSIIFPPAGGLNEKDFIYACKFLTEIYALKSSLLVRGYFQKAFQLKHGEIPIHLNLIRSRLTLIEGEPFKTLQEVFDAVVEMKRQAAILYPETSQYGGCYKEFLEEFGTIAQKYFPSTTPTLPAPEEVVEKPEEAASVEVEAKVV